MLRGLPDGARGGLDAGEAVQRVDELKALTLGGAPADGLQQWLDACDGSARCSAACPEDINVRQWVTIAKMKALEATRPREEGAANAADRFRHMAQAVRLLASMQLPSETLKKILAPAERRTADVLFYTGCNVLRTPHIVLNVMDILDALELDFDVVGGTAHCCGVYQFQEADLPTYERMGHRTFQRFGQSGASQGADLVPDLHQEFRRTGEGRRGAVVRPRPYQRIPGRQPRCAEDPIRGRSAKAPRGDPRASGYRGHGGEHRQAHARGAQSGAARARRRIPASPTPVAARPPSSRSASRRSIAALAEGAVAAGADTIVTMYHSCHRALAGAEAVYPLKVVNFTDVIAEALGRGGHPDYYRLYKAGGAMDEAVAAARTFLTNNGVRIDEASVQSLTADIFNETGLAGSREAFARGLHGNGAGGLREVKTSSGQFRFLSSMSQLLRRTGLPIHLQRDNDRRRRTE